MTKAELVSKIAEQTGVDKTTILVVVESFMDSVKSTLVNDGENVYLRGFGSFIAKQRAEKTGRNISNNTTVVIPAHCVPFFNPAKEFLTDMAEKTSKQ